MKADDPDTKPAPLGLIAGNGDLPRLTAMAAHAQGREVVCVGLAGSVKSDVKAHCDRYTEAGVIQIGRWVRKLRGFGASQTIMIGGVQKNTTMYDPLKWVRQLPDARALWLWYRVLRHDRRDQTVLATVANELANGGVPLIDSTTYLTEHMADQGVMTRRAPTDRERGDVTFGWPILMSVAGHDIGQAIAVKDRDVIAVEAMEGTAGLIPRSGELCRSGGWVLLKGATDEKDKRFDVPTVGVSTIEALHAAGATCLAIKAGGVILANKPDVIAKADELGLAIIGV